MLGHYLKGREQEAGNPETVVQLKEARRLIEEKDGSSLRTKRDQGTERPTRTQRRRLPTSTITTASVFQS